VGVLRRIDALTAAASEAVSSGAGVVECAAFLVHGREGAEPP